MVESCILAAAADSLRLITRLTSRSESPIFSLVGFWMFKLGIGNDSFSGISGGLSGVSMCGIVRVPFYDDYLYIYIHRRFSYLNIGGSKVSQNQGLK